MSGVSDYGGVQVSSKRDAGKWSAVQLVTAALENLCCKIDCCSTSVLD